MIRFALRQFRTQGLAALAGLVALAVLAAVTGPHLVHLYDTTVARCQQTGDCGQAHAALVAADGHLSSWLDALVLIVPALLGLFWGAPLVARELESGTFRLVWTQSVTRTRWLVVKVAVAGLATMAVTGVVSLIVTWWSSPLDRADGNPFSAFDQRDLVPVAYAAFAFALGLAVGVAVRRVLPAMAATLAGFVAVRLVIEQWVRPHLASPLRLVSSFAPVRSGQGITIGGSLQPGDWVLNERTVDAAGHTIAANGLPAVTVTLGGRVTFPDGQSCDLGHSAAAGHTGPGELGPFVQTCMARLHFHQVVTYQPGSRYWPFQWAESGIFVALALLLVGGCLWWVRRSSAGRRTGSLSRRHRWPAPGADNGTVAPLGRGAGVAPDRPERARESVLPAGSRSSAHPAGGGPDDRAAVAGLPTDPGNVHRKGMPWVPRVVATE